MEFTKEKTNITKGIAILLMFSNHLYAFPERLLHGNYYIPLIPFLNIELYIGNFGNVCVAIFLFLSGYGMFLGYSRSDKSSWNYSIGKLKDFYLIYWTYFLIFVPIGLIFFSSEKLWNSSEVRYSRDFLTFLEGFLGWSQKYNSEWWYVQMFILILLLLSPLYLDLGKRNPFLLIFTSSILFLFSWFLKIGYTDTPGFIFWQMLFSVGIICARFNFFSTHLVQRLEKIKIVWIILGLSLFYVVRLRFGAKIDFLFVPLFICCVLRIVDRLNLSRLSAYIGKYSFQMWLIHSFFCYYYFQDFIYSLRWSPIVYILLTTISLLIVLVIEYSRIYLLSKMKWLS